MIFDANANLNKQNIEYNELRTELSVIENRN
jgi:hypothetical protein